MIMRSLKASPSVPTWRQFEEGEDDMEQFLDAILRLTGLGHFAPCGTWTAHNFCQRTRSVKSWVSGG